MLGDPEEEDDFWFKPVWETEDEADLEPPGPPLPRARKTAAEPTYDYPLLAPLSHAQDTLARLEAKPETLSDAVAIGLRADGVFGGGWLAAARACVDSPLGFGFAGCGLNRLLRRSGIWRSSWIRDAFDRRFGIRLGPLPFRRCRKSGPAAGAFMAAISGNAQLAAFGRCWSPQGDAAIARLPGA